MFLIKCSLLAAV